MYRRSRDMVTHRFPTSITTSINRELVHGIPSKTRKLKAGDIVSIDCGTVLDGLVADSAFTAGVGEISPEAQKLLEVTEGALHAAIEKMCVGNRTGDVSAAIQNHVESHGFHVTREYTGHGVGQANARRTTGSQLWQARFRDASEGRYDDCH